MKNFKHQKNDMIFLFKQSKLPEIMLSSEEYEKIKELIFNEKSDTPETCKTPVKKVKLSSCFITENKSEEVKIKPRSASTFKPNNNNYIHNNNNSENTIKRNFFHNSNQTNEENNPQINNDTKSNQAKNKIPSNDYMMCRENSISIVNLVLIENIRQDRIVNLKNDLGYLLNFSNENKKIENDRVIVKGRKFSEVSNNSSNPKTTPNTDTNNDKVSYANSETNPSLNNVNMTNSIFFDINIIFKFNEFLNYSKDDPLWYIYQPLTKSSVGPLSSNALEKMYKENIINTFSEIRLIDVYNFNKKNNFSYLKLLEFNDVNILDNLLISNIVQNSLKSNKNYKIKIKLNSVNEFESIEMIRKIEESKSIEIEKIKCPIDIENRGNNFLNKHSPIIIKSENQNQNIGGTLFNKSNKIQKGANLFNNAPLPSKPDCKIIPLDPNRVRKNMASPQKEDVIESNKKEEITPKKNENKVLTSFTNINNPIESKNNEKDPSKIQDNQEKGYDNSRNNVDIVNDKYYNKNDQNNYNNNYNNKYYYDNQNKSNRRYSKNKRGSMPPKKHNFNYDNYDYDNNENYYEGNNNYYKNSYKNKYYK